MSMSKKKKKSKIILTKADTMVPGGIKYKKATYEELADENYDLHELLDWYQGLAKEIGDTLNAFLKKHPEVKEEQEG